MAKNKRQSIEQFREFVKGHPHLRNEVRRKETTWQELFEEWYLLGADHPRWNVEQERAQQETVQEHPKAVEQNDKELVQSQEFLTMLLGALKSMDINQIQQYIRSANQAIGTIQGLLEVFQGDRSTKEEPPKQEVEKRGNPFVFRKD